MSTRLNGHVLTVGAVGAILASLLIVVLPGPTAVIVEPLTVATEVLLELQLTEPDGPTGPQ